MKRLLFILLAVVLVPSALYVGVLLLTFVLAFVQRDSPVEATPSPVAATPLPATAVEVKPRLMAMKTAELAEGLPMVFQRSDWPAMEFETVGHLTAFRELVEKGEGSWLRAGVRVEVIADEKDDPAIRVRVEDGKLAGTVGWVLRVDLVEVDG